jgi:hypothetical protein
MRDRSSRFIGTEKTGKRRAADADIDGPPNTLHRTKDSAPTTDGRG